MRSNNQRSHLFSVAWLCVITATLTSCSWLRDQPKETAQIKGESLDLTCLNRAPIQLQKLFAGEYTAQAADQQEVKAIWTCLDRSLYSFSEYTEGSQPGIYTDTELSTFANRYLPKEKPLNPSFTRAIFKLKQAVLGGTDRTLTDAEIVGLRRKLTGFGSMILPLAPYMAELVDINSNRGTDDKTLAAAALNTFVLKFADLLSDSKNSLNWVDLSAFVSELEKYTRTEKPTALTYVKEQTGIYQYFKLLLVGGDEFAIEKTKWRPIFEAISHFYNALFLAKNTVESLDELAIEVESTPKEQQIAVEKLNGLLQVLKMEPELASRTIVSNLADRWAKVLILNAVLFPTTQGSIALKTFLGSPGLRKLAGNLADQLIAFEKGKQDPASIQALADNFVSFIDQASSSQTGSTTQPSLSLSQLKDYVIRLKPLFEVASDHEAALVAVDLMREVLPVLSGKSSENFSAKDLRAAIQKAVDFYLIWGEHSKLENNEAIAQSLEVLLRKPAFIQIRQESVQNTLKLAERLTQILKIKFTLPGETSFVDLQRWVRNGFQLKSVLFGSSDSLISGFEIKTVADLWNPFRSGKDTAQSLSELSQVLKTAPLAKANIEKLVQSIDTFLPHQQQIQSSAIDANFIGLIKATFVGGTSTTLETKEYSTLAALAASLWRELEPHQKTLESNFKFGLNSTSLEIAIGALQGLSQYQKEAESPVTYARLHRLFMEVAKRQKLNLRATTLEKLLIGLQHRMLGRKLSPKPNKADGVVTSAHLQVLLKLLTPVMRDWQELERVYTGVSGSMTKKDLLLKLKTPELQHLVKVIPPILDGKEKLVHFTGFGGGTDYDQYDLTYKALMRRVVQWIFPAYQIEADPLKHTGRLTYQDLVDLLTDINDAILDFGLTYGVTPPPVTATKRMQTINLFTKNGNGDDYLDFDETTEFLTISTGGKTLLDRTLGKLLQDCKVNTEGGKRQFIPYSCLTESYSKPRYFTQTYQEVVPEMVRQYSKYNDEERQAFIRSMFNATDPRWESKKELPFADFEVFLAIPYYAESIFERLDTNHDQVVNFTEAMAGFPLFCREIKKAAGPSVKGSCEPNEAPRQIEAVYGHLLFFGEAPRGPKPGDNLVVKAREVKNFLMWVYRWNRLPRDPAIRNAEEPQLTRKDILQIISNLAMATDVPPTAAAEPAPSTR